MTDSSNNQATINQATIVLLSGGADSSTLLKVIAAKRSQFEGKILNALYLRSGFKSDEKEIEAARKAIEAEGGQLDVVDISDVVKRLGGARPTMHAGAPIASFGNTMIISIALAYASANRYQTIAIGLHKDDAMSNPEYGEQYLRGVEELARSVDCFSPTIEAPFVNMTKSEVFALGASLGVDYSHTWSCIEGRALHCGSCGACLARRDAFVKNGMEDPTKYAIEPDLNGKSVPFIRETGGIVGNVNSYQ